MPIAQELAKPMRPAVMAYRRAESAQADVCAAHRRADIMAACRLPNASKRAAELRRYAITLEPRAYQALVVADLSWANLPAA